MWFLYDAGISLFITAIRLLSLFNAKAKKIVLGHKNQILSIDTLSLSKPVICFHCASLGEFEMIKPLLTSTLRGKYYVVLTFFSPSGYEHAKCDDLVDQKFYLPFDKRNRINQFLDKIHPNVFVFVKYDLWFRLIQALQKRQAKLLIVNGLFRPSQFLLSKQGKFLFQYIKKFDHIFLQSESSFSLLAQHGFSETKLTQTQDLRYDRVKQICENVAPIDRIKRFKGSKKLLILGSSWPHEEQLLAQIMNRIKGACKVLIVPHDISAEHVNDIKNQFASFNINLWTENEKMDSELLIINQIGLLSVAYQYGDFAFIGGGFGKGLHNILEAATFGMPILCGPKTDKYPEAQLFENEGVLFKVSDSIMLENHMIELLNHPERTNQIASKSRKLILEKSGASEIIHSYLIGLH